MCDKIKDNNGDTFPHEHKGNKIIFFIPEPIDEEDIKLMAEQFKNKELEFVLVKRSKKT